MGSYKAKIMFRPIICRIKEVRDKKWKEIEEKLKVEAVPKVLVDEGATTAAAAREATKDKMAA